MCQARDCSLRLFATTLVWTLAASLCQATVVAVTASNADAYFGSQSDAYQNSNPVVAPWSPIGAGPYFGTSLPAGVPAPPGGNTPPSNVTPIAPAPSISSFSDGFGNTANSAIVAYVAPGVGTMDDAQIALRMNLTQTGTASYAYEQVNYSADFSLANTSNSAGFLSGALDSLVTRNYSVSGNVGAYVNFGGVMNYWDVPTSGPATLLGTLTFSYYNATPGAFSTVVSGSNFIGTPGSWVNNPDSIRITGDFFVAGDPSSINVESLPEPSSLVLAACGALGLAAFARCGRWSKARADNSHTRHS